MEDNAPDPLSAEQLQQRCDPRLVQGGSDDAGAEHGLIGQDRGLRALRLAVEIRDSDFNLFVVGPQGTGRHTAIKRALEAHAATRPVPPDWAYVNNFDAPHKPVALRLPVGTAVRLRTEMERVVDDLASEIPALFESDEYQSQRRAIEEEYGARQEEAMADFTDRARAEDIALLRTPTGFMVAAMKDGEVVKTDVFKDLPEEEQARIDEKIERFQDELVAVLREAPKLERAQRERVEALNAEMAERAVSARIAEAEAALADAPGISAHLARVREDMIGNPELFLQAAMGAKAGPFPEAAGKAHEAPPFRRYRVNVFVSHEPEAPPTAPVVIEDLPTLDRLIGRVEHQSQMGSLVTDFTLIRPGALHRANGGYLVLDIRQVLREPLAWETLKTSLKQRSITLTSLAERLSLITTTSLEPDPIPIDVRVVLVGDRRLHALLVMLDPDTAQLFKIHADFEESVARSDETLRGLGTLIRQFAAQNDLLTLADDGVARLLDEATRIAEDARKLTLRLSPLTDILREAEHYTRMDGRAQVAAEDIARAVDERDRRAARLRDRTQEAIARHTVMIETDGRAVGQVNGLSVLDFGGIRFGRPSRITARTRMGGGKLVDIEREVELGGPVHSKGVMILAGYLTATYALDVPFSLHASLVFEQSYGGIEGDSASCAELVALLSAISEVSILQGWAITGSVNQFGQVQAIGGVNEKIEGFFDVCAERGLTGEQGVVIPAVNIDHLMLRDRVVEAVAAGRFHVAPVAHVDQALRRLTGRPAGVRDAKGRFPAESVNARVEARLRRYAETRHGFMTRDRNFGPGGRA